MVHVVIKNNLTLSIGNGPVQKVKAEESTQQKLR